MAWTSRGHPGVIRADIPAQNFGQGPRNPWPKHFGADINFTHFGADVHDPRRGFQKLRSEKLWAEFSFPSFATILITALGVHASWFSSPKWIAQKHPNAEEAVSVFSSGLTSRRVCDCEAHHGRQRSLGEASHFPDPPFPCFFFCIFLLLFFCDFHFVKNKGRHCSRDPDLTKHAPISVPNLAGFQRRPSSQT